MKENKHLELSLLAVFRDGLKKMLPELIQLFDLIQENLQDENRINNFISRIRTLKGEAKIVQLDLVIEFCNCLEEFFNKVLKKEASLGSMVAKAIKKILSVWQELVNAENLTQWEELLEQHHNEYINACLLLKKDTSSEPKESNSNDDKSEINVDATLYELFLIEVQNQTSLLASHLLDFEKSGKKIETIDSLMRAAHSIKGAARILQLQPLVQLSHHMEDCFVAVQTNSLNLTPENIDLLFKSTDLLAQVSKIAQIELKTWLKKENDTINHLISQIKETILKETSLDKKEELKYQAQNQIEESVSENIKQQETFNRVLRVTAHNLNRLMGLAGESVIESQYLPHFSTSLLKIKKMMHTLAIGFDSLRDAITQKKSSEYLEEYLSTLQKEINACSYELSDRIAELDMLILRHSRLSDRLYSEVVETRMRPFADILTAFPRLVRDLSRELNKKIYFEMLGKNTPVDRDILEMLETPLNHLIRNAVDHGIENADQRVKLGKNPEGTIKVEAMHRAGVLVIHVSDDGNGIDIEQLRKSIVARNLVKQDMAERLTHEELLEFIFLPGFSTKLKANEISGRGVGVNVAASMVREVGGTIRVQSDLGKGTTFQLTLPLTLSVLRALIVEIDKEPYAFPLAKIDRALKIKKEEVQTIENMQYIQFEEKNIGLILASQVFDLKETKILEDVLPVIVISDRMDTFGMVVDNFLGEKELVVHELDSVLGKIQNISSGAFLDDGSPVLVVDIEDLVRSIDNLVSKNRLHKFGYQKEEKTPLKKKKRILIVDDSITVREVEGRLLQNEGYDVHTAVNGVDGLNTLNMGHFDLLITDVDMPRMNGLELIKIIRNDIYLKNLPIMIVSYKEREEDRLLGLEAGANYYLSKSSFHDETLKNAVEELIGSSKKEMETPCE